jgi:hypothetical protein
VVLLLASPALAAAPAIRRDILVVVHDIPLPGNGTFFHLEPEVILANEGSLATVTFQNPAANSQASDLYFDGYHAGGKAYLASPGESVSFSFPLNRSGSFAFYSDIPGQREGGAHGTLVVNATVESTVVPPYLPFAIGGLIVALFAGLIAVALHLGRTEP